MELEVSQVRSYGIKPLIKKGYYPAQLLEVKEFTDNEGNLKEGKYGNQLILNFAIFKPGEKDEPTKVMQFTDNFDLEQDVVIPKFVYHIYKDVKTGAKRTAISPESAITKVFTSLGWKFDPGKSLNPEKFIGSWVEVNLDDYVKENSEGEKITASTIKDIGVYKGPKPKVSYILDEKSDKVSEEIDLSDSDLPE